MVEGTISLFLPNEVALVELVSNRRGKSRPLSFVRVPVRFPWLLKIVLAAYTCVLMVRFNLCHQRYNVT